MAIHLDVDDYKHTSARVILFPVDEAALSGPDMIKSFFHLTYLCVFNPYRNYYLLYDKLNLFFKYLYLLHEKGYTFLKGGGEDIKDAYEIPARRTYLVENIQFDYASIMNMLYKENCLKDPQIEFFLKLLLPTVMVNIPPGVKTELPFVGYTLKGDLIHSPASADPIEVTSAEINTLTDKGYTPILKWLAHWIAHCKPGRNDISWFSWYALNEVAAPFLPMVWSQSDDYLETTFINIIVQAIKIDQRLSTHKWDRSDWPTYPTPPDKSDMAPKRPNPPKVDAQTEYLPVQYSYIARMMWGNLLYDGMPILRLDSNTIQAQEVIKQFLKKLEGKKVGKVLVDALKFMGILLSPATESLNPSHNSFLSFPPVFGLEAAPPVPIDAQSEDEDDTEEEEDEEDPSTIPQMSSPADDSAIQNGNNPSASVQADDHPVLDPDMPNNAMGDTTSPTFSPGSNLDTTVDDPLVPCVGGPMPLSQAASDFQYMRAVDALSRKLQEEDSDKVSPVTKNTLSTWCGQMMWMYPVSQTQALVSKLGLEKHLSVFKPYL